MYGTYVYLVLTKVCSFFPLYFCNQQERSTPLPHQWRAEAVIRCRDDGYKKQKFCEWTRITSCLCKDFHTIDSIVGHVNSHCPLSLIYSLRLLSKVPSGADFGLSAGPVLRTLVKLCTYAVLFFNLASLILDSLGLIRDMIKIRSPAAV
jgi:hypothetical protein